MKVPLLVVSVLACLPVLVAPDSVPAARADTPVSDSASLDGTYVCEGTRPDGSPYRGTVNIIRYNGAYQVVWNVGRDERYFGIALLNADVLAVSYFGGAHGVVAYKVEQTATSARLVGRWTVASAQGQVFTETLTRVSNEVTALPPPPDPAPERRRQRPTISARMRPA